MKYILFTLLITFSSCSKNNDINIVSNNLEGKWIEFEARMDTLYFQPFDNKNSMKLNRGKEIINGYLLPKYGSGYYRYYIDAEKIYLNSAFSSDSNYKDYFFKISGDTLFIGNFYNSILGKNLTFIKLGN